MEIPDTKVTESDAVAGEDKQAKLGITAEDKKVAESTDKSQSAPETLSEIFEGVEKDGEGNLFVKIQLEGDKEPRTVIKGKTEKELATNVLKVLTDNTKHISTLESERKAKKIDADKALNEGFNKKDLVIPTEEQIVTTIASDIYKQASKYGITEEMFNWGDKEWKQYQNKFNTDDEIRVSDYTVTKARDRIEKFNSDYKERVQAESSKVNILNANVEIGHEELDTLQEMWLEAGLDPNSYDFKEIVKMVQDDPKSWTIDKVSKEALIKSGRIVFFGTRELNKLLKEKSEKEQTSNTYKKEQEKLRDEREKARDIRPSGGSGEGDKNKPKTFAKNDLELAERLAKIK